MKVRNILYASLAAVALTACEDYTEHNFGSDGELYPPVETSSYTLRLGRTDYVTIAASTENEQKALELGTDSLGVVDSIYYYALKRLGEEKCLNNMTPPASYLPAYIEEKLPYATDGATVTITVKEDTIPFVMYPAYVRQTGTEGKERYLLVPESADVCLTGTQSEGYGYMSALPVSRYDRNHIRTDESLKQALLTLVLEGDHYLIYNVDEAYLCAEEDRDDLLYCLDLGDLDDGAQAQWLVTVNDEGVCELRNLATGGVLCWDASAARACMVIEPGGERSAEMGLFKYADSNPDAKQSSTENVRYMFVKRDGVWQIKDSYLDLPLVNTGSSTDAVTIQELVGFNIVIVDMPSTLTYVWKLDDRYGLRASAYANNTYNVTEAWAVSPSIDLSSAVAPCLLEFDQAQKYAGDCSQELTVWVTADNVEESPEMDPEAYNWEQLEIETYPDGSNWDYLNTRLDLSGYAGLPNVHVAFKYVSTSSAAATWEIKNMVVKNGK